MEKRTWFGVIIGICVAILPFVISQNIFYGADAAKYFFVVGVTSIMVLYFCYLVFSGKHTIQAGARWLVLLGSLSIGVLYLSAFKGVYPAQSLLPDTLRSTGVFFLTYVALFAFIISELFSRADWQFTRRAVVFSGLLFAILTYFGGEGGFGIGGKFGYINLSQSGLTFANSTFAGSFLVLVLIFALIEFCLSNKNTERYIYGISALAILFSPVLLHPFDFSLGHPFGILGSARASSATALAFFIYTGGLLGLKKIAKEKLMMVWSILWVLGIITSLSLLFVSGSVIQQKYIEESGSARILVWEQSYDAFKEKPVFGWGPENMSLALEGHVDSNLYLKENGGEVWFDRAHNVLVDSLVSVGIFGVLVFLLTFVYLLFLIVRSVQKRIIVGIEGYLLGAFFVAHFLQLQTSFNIAGTYVLCALVFGYILFLERQSVKERVLATVYARAIAGVLTLLVLVASQSLFFGEYARKHALFDIFTTKDPVQQEKLIVRALSEPADFEAIRLSSMSLIKGLLSQIEGDPQEAGKIVSLGLSQLDLYENAYQAAIEARPNDYRIRMNYAYLLIIETTLGNNKLTEAKQILDYSYKLSPQSPITPTLDSIVELYSGNITGAKEKIEEALNLNSEVPFVQEVQVYLLEQEKNFPNITVIKLQNL